VVETSGSGAAYLLEDLDIAEEEVAEQLKIAGDRSSQIPAERSVRMVQAQRHGPAAAAAILDYAKEHDIDLIVMGTHGRRGIDRLLAGSVAEEVVRLSPCPVLTLCGDKEPVPRRAVRTILVPIDFSEHSRAALRYAGELAKVYDARMEALHVIEEDILPTVYGLDAVAPATEQVKADAARALQDLIAEEGDVEQVTATVMVGHPAAEVLAYAKAHRADLIVIATHGRTGLQHFLMGSVAEKVVRRAPCPVFTVKSFGRDLVSQGQGSSVQEMAGQ
jgi:nucleotide-binding universal stress UspA family protein